MLAEYILSENIKRYKEKLKSLEDDQQRLIIERLLQEARAELLLQCTSGDLHESHQIFLAGEFEIASSASSPPDPVRHGSEDSRHAAPVTDQPQEQDQPSGDQAESDGTEHHLTVLPVQGRNAGLPAVRRPLKSPPLQRVVREETMTGKDTSAADNLSSSKPAQIREHVRKLLRKLARHVKRKSVGAAGALKIDRKQHSLGSVAHH